jgi:hypothetical protein
MSTPRFLLVVTRAEPVGDLSAAAVGALTGRLVVWVAALRRWRLLHAVAIDMAPDPGAVRGCLLVTASDLAAAYGLAASCPLGAGGAIAVLPVREAAVPGDR